MRTFVAIEISNNDVVNSIERLQKRICINAKAIESRNLHFTLQFLGEVSENILQKIKQALSTIEFSSFNVNLIGIGAFPKPKSPRVIWIGTDTDGGNLLIELSQKVNKVLEPLGLISDKAFKPHITVFRIKKKVRDMTKELESQGMADFGTQKISSIKLKKSELTPNGPIYSDLIEVNSIS
jgi:RNA 2',3'-cyclic 3'-phosphodiesterase